MFYERQGILAKIPFRDGEVPKYSRTYLVISANEQGITVLNVSSTEGKEHKVSFPSNYLLKQHNPPFLKSSFVKLDSAVVVPKEKFGEFEISVLHGGDLLDEQDFSTILTGCARYRT